MKRKTIVTALLLCVTLYAPLSVLSQDFQMNGTVLVKYNGRAANVTIPAGVTAIGDSAFSYNDLRSVTIPAGVTSIGESAFSECRSLTSVTIPAGVTSIGESAFSGCYSLTSIAVDPRNSVYSSVEGVLFNKNRTVLIEYPKGKEEENYTIPTGVTTIGSYAFFNCSLNSVAIPSSVTSIGEYAFFWCSFTSIIIPSSVTSIGEYAFGNGTLPSAVRNDIIKRFGEGPLRNQQ